MFVILYLLYTHTYTYMYIVFNRARTPVIQRDIGNLFILSYVSDSVCEEEEGLQEKHTFTMASFVLTYEWLAEPVETMM